MEVQLNGFVISSILLDQFNSTSDTEGFLLGETLNVCSAVIDDYSSDAKEHKYIYVVKNIVSCWGLGSWYNNTCDLDIEKINTTLGKRKEQVLGWFRTRRHTTQAVSLKERTLHIHLQQLFNQPSIPSSTTHPLIPSSNSHPCSKNSSLISSTLPISTIASHTTLKSVQPTSKLPLLFLLHTTNNPNSNPLSSYNFQFSSLDSIGNFKAVDMKVSNLTIPSPLEYRQGRGACVSDNKDVQTILTNSDDFLRDRSDVDKVIQITSDLVSQISRMELDWMQSECEVNEEVKELLELRRQVQKAEEEVQDKVAASQLQNATPISHPPKTATMTKNICPTSTPNNTASSIENHQSQAAVLQETTLPSTHQCNSQLPSTSSNQPTKTYQLITFDDDEQEDVNSKAH